MGESNFRAQLGWEIQCNGAEISQFTYFQQMGGIECKPVSLELTYGLERIAMMLQNVDSTRLNGTMRHYLR